MVSRRLREFTHGRHCARAAMQALELTPAPVIKSADRSPQWPDGVAGSISHTGEIAAAVVGHSRHYESLGLDIENAEPLDRASRDLILHPDERAADGAQAKLLFSIKEAIYKCLYPTVQEYIDFQEMTVGLEPSTERFQALPDTPKVGPELAGRLEGRYRVTADLVIAAAWIRAN